MAKKKESARMQKLAELGCIVCRNKGYPDTPTEIDHIIDIKDKNRDHIRTIPLCPIHHRTGLRHLNPGDRTGWDRWREVGYHQAPQEFARRYGSKRQLLEQIDEMMA